MYIFIILENKTSEPFQIQYRKDENNVHLSHFLQCIQATKNRFHMFGYTSHICHQKQVSCRELLSIFSSNPILKCRLVLKSLLQDLIYLKIIILSCQFNFFYNRFALLKLFSFLVTVYTSKIKTCKIWDHA